MKQGSQAHRQKERCCAAEKECNYHRSIKETKQILTGMQPRQGQADSNAERGRFQRLNHATATERHFR